jgi:hypothetical protein
MLGSKRQEACLCWGRLPSPLLIENLMRAAVLPLILALSLSCVTAHAKTPDGRPAHLRDCAAVTPAQVDAHVQAALAAWAGGQGAAFLSARDAALTALPCVTAPLSPRVSTDLHLVLALGAYADADLDQMNVELRAWLWRDPTKALGEPYVLPGDDISVAIDAARLAPVPLEIPLRVPAGATLRVDGRKAETRPEGLPVVAQLVTEGGVVWTSAYIAPEDPLWPKDLPPPPRSTRHRVGKGVLLVGAAAGTVGLGLQAVTLGSAAQAGLIARGVANGDPEITPADEATFEAAIARSRVTGTPGLVMLGVGAGVSLIGWGMTW